MRKKQDKFSCGDNGFVNL